MSKDVRFINNCAASLVSVFPVMPFIVAAGLSFQAPAQDMMGFRRLTVGDTLRVVARDSLPGVLMVVSSKEHNRAVPDSVAVFHDDESARGSFCFGYSVLGSYPRIEEVWVGDLDQNGRLDLLFECAPDFPTDMETQVEIVELVRESDGGIIPHLTLSVGTISSFVDFDGDRQREVVIRRRWDEPGPRSWDDSVFPAYPVGVFARVLDDGYQIANDLFDSSFAGHLEKAQAEYARIVETFMESPTRDLAEALLYKANEVVVRLVPMLNHREIREWTDAQAAVFESLSPYADVLLSNWDGSFRALDPVRALHDMRLRAEELIDWVTTKKWRMRFSLAR